MTISRPASEVYEYLAEPANFPRWSEFLTSMGPEGDEWLAATLLGKVRIRFVARNVFGIVDHHVTMPNGATVYVPLRVVANENGAEVLFTVFRRRDMTDQEFEDDMAMVLKDLTNLRHALELPKT